MTLVLPNPQAVTPAEVATLGSQVVLAAQNSDDVHEVTEMAARWSAIAEYVRRTSTEGIAQAEATKRRLEIRIGQLSPAAANDGTRGNQHTATPDAGNGSLPKNRLTEARQMAEHPEIVEEVIANSTDADPPTKAKIIGAIKDAMRPSIEAEIARKAAAALERWPELGDPDGGLDTPAKIADAADLLSKDPWRIEHFRRHIEVQRRRREPDYEPPKLDPLVGLYCAACDQTYTHECSGDQA